MSTVHRTTRSSSWRWGVFARSFYLSCHPAPNPCLSFIPTLSRTYFYPCRRREREQKKLAKAQKVTGKKVGKKKAAQAKAKASAKKKKKKSADTSGDAALAASLTSTRESLRNRDASRSKAKKAAALKAIRDERSSKFQRDESDSDLDYGDEGASDSDDDYEDEAAISKPWLQKRKTRLQRAMSSEESSDEEEDDREGRLSRDEKAAATFVPAEPEDYLKVTIPRRRLARWCNEPFFEDAVKDMYVRLAIGKDKTKMKACYRLCQIVGVESKPAEYKFPQMKNENPVRVVLCILNRFSAIN